MESKTKKSKVIKQEISKDKKVYCITTIPYPLGIVRSMRKAGYKVREIRE